MAKTNKTDFALLGILNIEPMSGYDIRSFIRESIGYFWQESYGQIYPALKRLHSRRLVSKKKAKQSRGPAKFVYSLTPRGKAALVKWLASEPEPETVRIELLLKLFFGTTGNRRDQIGHLESLLARQRERFAQFDHVEREVLPLYVSNPSYSYWRSTLRYGQRLTEARAAWCEETLAWLKEGKSKGKTTV